MNNKVEFDRLRSFYENELPKYVKKWYDEFDKTYLNNYVPLSTVKYKSKKTDIFTYIELFIRENYILDPDNQIITIDHTNPHLNIPNYYGRGANEILTEAQNKFKKNNG